MFYSALNGNGEKLDSLEASIPFLSDGNIRVIGYGDDFNIVKIRCNRVKSELIVRYGLSLDVNINRIFRKNTSGHRFTVWISPAVFGQFFDAGIYTAATGSRYSDGTTRPDVFSFGAGGSVSLRYRIIRELDIQLKNTVMWMTDNNFDGIRTIFGETRHNAAWIPQIGIIWNINSSCKTKGKQ